MNQSTMFVGLDVHKESIDVAQAPEGQGEVRSYGRITGELEAVDKIISRLRSGGWKLSFVYEAGPCGYAPYRHLTKKGFACTVVAPSMIPKKPGDRIKNDRQEAISLARLHRAAEAPVVEALQALRGVSFNVAVTTVAELGDLTRFHNPRQLMAFLGLVPSQYSSGPRQRLGVEPLSSLGPFMAVS